MIDPVLRALYAAAYLAALQPERPAPGAAPSVRMDTPDRPPIVPLRGAQKENPR